MIAPYDARMNASFQTVLLLTSWYVSSCAAASQASHDFKWNLRRLEEGADEDDDEWNADQNNDSSSRWYDVSTHVNHDSITYDLLQGFVIVAMLGVMIWAFWECLVVCGLCPDPRLFDRQRDVRLVRDGRGVFAPLKRHADYDDEDHAWDDNSQVSMEFGDCHFEDDGEPNVRQEDERIFKEAQDYFDAPQKHKTFARQLSHEDNDDEDNDEQFLDLEMVEPNKRGDTIAETWFL